MLTCLYSSQVKGKTKKATFKQLSVGQTCVSICSSLLLAHIKINTNSQFDFTNMCTHRFYTQIFYATQLLFHQPIYVRLWYNYLITLLTKYEFILQCVLFTKSQISSVVFVCREVACNACELDPYVSMSTKKCLSLIRALKERTVQSSKFSSFKQQTPILSLLVLYWQLNHNK